MLVLVINAGSSSLKYQVIDLHDDRVLAKGLVERIGEPDSPVRDHSAALADVAEELEASLDGRPLDAVGHRVVHGGERFSAPVLIDDAVVEAVEGLSPLAPLHNPANVQGIRAITARWPELPQVAVFDTAFHHTMPEEAWRYAVPDELYTRHGIRRYGFHGTSHDFVTATAARYLGVDRDDLNAIVLHLGNGASATAVRAGCSVDTTMGYTPLAGLVMGTRSGDVDPSVVTQLVARGDYTAEELDRILNKESGLLGLAGQADMRAVVEAAEAGDERAAMALDVAAYRVAKVVGGYHVAVGGAQAVIFTAGIGENSVAFRARVLERLTPLGVVWDAAANEGQGDAGPDGVRELSNPESAVRVLVVPTNEELAIAQATAALVSDDAR
ncbi:MAG: acetate kinase [Micrococcus sp.]|nr:acetate kinase [Micrococcus sp.]